MQRCQSVFIKRRRAICSPNNRYDVNHVNSVLVIYLVFFSVFACDPVAVPCILKVSVPSPSSQMNKWNVPCADLCVRCMLSLSRNLQSHLLSQSMHAFQTSLAGTFFPSPPPLSLNHSLCLCPWCRVVPTAMPRANSRGTNGNEMLISAVSFQHMRSTAVFCACVCMQRHVNGR